MISEGRGKGGHNKRRMGEGTVAEEKGKRRWKFKEAEVEEEKRI